MDGLGGSAFILHRPREGQTGARPVCPSYSRFGIEWLEVCRHKSHDVGSIVPAFAKKKTQGRGTRFSGPVRRESKAWATRPVGVKMAAPAESRTPNMHRARRIAPREWEWKHGDSGHSAGTNTFLKKNRNEWTHLFSPIIV